MKKIVYCIFLCCLFLISASQFQLNYQNSEKLSITIRGNYRVYIDGQYKGLKNKEMRGLFTVNHLDAPRVNYELAGKVYSLSKMIHDNRNFAYQVDQIDQVKIVFDATGANSRQNESHFFPIIQGIPYFSNKPILKLDQYGCEGNIVVDLFDDKEQLLIPSRFEIIYRGKEQLNGEVYDYFQITGRFNSFYSSEKIKKINGYHNLKLFFDSENGEPVFMSDRFEEIILKQNQQEERKNGFYSYFYKNVKKMNRKKLEKLIKDKLETDKNNDLELNTHAQGISLILQNLNFKANSSQLLDNEKNKLNQIIEFLKTIKNRSFLIIGHTANVGSPENQLMLSLERSKTIADLLIKRGIDPKKLLFSGKGASEPVVPNDSEENMRKNRRVEIIILED